LSKKNDRVIIEHAHMKNNHHHANKSIRNEQEKEYQDQKNYTVKCRDKLYWNYHLNYNGIEQTISVLQAKIEFEMN